MWVKENVFPDLKRVAIFEDCAVRPLRDMHGAKHRATLEFVTRSVLVMVRKKHFEAKSVQVQGGGLSV